MVCISFDFVVTSTIKKLYHCSPTAQEIMDNEIATALGWRLKTLRANNKFTQRELAEKLGVGQVYISDLESGKRMLNTQTLFKVVDIFNIDLNYFDIRKKDIDTKVQNNIEDNIEQICRDVKEIKQQINDLTKTLQADSS